MVFKYVWKERNNGFKNKFQHLITICTLLMKLQLSVY